ncbi:hypothetical protein EJO66_32345 [Variovorax beijingensis]|uniref:Uncharacterized protein n=2 Tax=Variovorax beijingensis TaxID=2496117 RepID=A0ABX9ZX98_9BURK|nr:hypothetical protein EJO66_32345 [Variovorax beijingensis]
MFQNLGAQTASLGRRGMGKSWGIARFYGMGSMEYRLESGEWLADSRLFDGAPIQLFETMAEADAQAEKLDQQAQPHGVQFMIDSQGKVLTVRKKETNQSKKIGRR